MNGTRALALLLAPLTLTAGGCATSFGLDPEAPVLAPPLDAEDEDSAGDVLDAELDSDPPVEDLERRVPHWRRLGSPLGRYDLYTAPGGHAEQQADEWRSSDPEAAALMDEMAEKPLGYWVGDWTYDVEGTVDDALTEAGDELRTLVLYNIPNRDCGSYSSGGVDDAEAYRDFIDEVAAGLEGRLALVVLEPDALPLVHCLDDEGVAERHELLAYGVTTLGAAGARVYIDAGDSNWIDSTTIAEGLLAAGVEQAAGFALNVAHTEYTEDEVAYAEEIRAIVGENARYVIDTGRNGLGPAEDNEWCNPEGRALGVAPTTRTRTRGLDAYLWVKPPGESDGECNGGPSPGTWWAEYALGLAERAAP